MLAVAARQWWVLLLQGVLGVAVGILAIIYPDIALGTIALLFAAWAIVSGVAQLAAGWRVAEVRGTSWPFLISGSVSAIAGVLALLSRNHDPVPDPAARGLDPRLRADGGLLGLADSR